MYVRNIFIIIILILSGNVFAQTRIFFEDCEDTNYTTWFLERSEGTSEATYWSELTSELTRSSDNPYAGSYCMTYDPWVTGNPHTNVGIPTTYGNTSNFNLADYELDEMYITWEHKWQTGISYSGSMENKNIYIGYGELDKGGNNNWHIYIRSNPGYNLQHNWYRALDGVNSEDGNWHKMELYINLGTTGPTGSAWFKVDGVYVLNETGLTFRNQQEINGADLLLIQWPANTSGTPTGNARQWLDNLEIWDGLPGNLNDRPAKVKNLQRPRN